MMIVLAAAVAVLATALVITRAEAVHALLYLVVSFLAVAVLFFLVGAPLAAALEVIVYAGAIMVLFVFVVMMIDTGVRPPRRRAGTSLRAWAGPAALALVLFGEMVAALTARPGRTTAGAAVAPDAVGAALFSGYLLAVELAAVLLLAAVVGAFHLAHRPPVRRHRFFEEAPK